MAHSKSCFSISEGNSTVVIARLLSTMTLGDDGEEKSVEIRENNPKFWKIIHLGELLFTMAHSEFYLSRWVEILADMLRILLSTMAVSKTMTEYLNLCDEKFGGRKSIWDMRKVEITNFADEYRELLSTMARSGPCPSKFCTYPTICLTISWD